MRSRPYIRPAKLRNSAPVRRPKSAMPSGTTPIWRLTSTGWALRSRPRISIRPELGASRPVSILMVVDFPAPFGPRKPKNCPGATRRSTPSTARSSPKRRVSAWVEMVGATSIKPLNLAYPCDSRATVVLEVRLIGSGSCARVRFRKLPAERAWRSQERSPNPKRCPCGAAAP